MEVQLIGANHKNSQSRTAFGNTLDYCGKKKHRWYLIQIDNLFQVLMLERSLWCWQHQRHCCSPPGQDGSGSERGYNCVLLMRHTPSHGGQYWTKLSMKLKWVTYFQCFYLSQVTKCTVSPFLHRTNQCRLLFLLCKFIWLIPQLSQSFALKKGQKHWMEQSQVFKWFLYQRESVCCDSD